MSIIDKRSLAWILSCVFVWSSYICSVTTAGASNRTAAEYFNEANVFFEVQRDTLRGTLIIKGGHHGKVEFEERVKDSDFGGFEEAEKAGFTLSSPGNGYLEFAYKGFSIHVEKKGDIVLSAAESQAPDCRHLKHVAIKTSGKLENNGYYMFDSVTTWAGKLVNTGTLITENASQLYNDNLLNSGTIQLNCKVKVPEPTKALTGKIATATGFSPNVGVNYGTFKVDEKLVIDRGFSYQECGSSSLGSLEVKGKGKIIIGTNGKMGVLGNVTGEIGKLQICEDAALRIGNIDLSTPIDQLEIDQKGIFDLQTSSSIWVPGSFVCAGEMTSEQDLMLRLTQTPETLPGRVEAKGSLRVQCEHPDKTLLVRRKDDRGGGAGEGIFGLGYMDLAVFRL